MIRGQCELILNKTFPPIHAIPVIYFIQRIEEALIVTYELTAPCPLRVIIDAIESSRRKGVQNPRRQVKRYVKPS